MRIGPYHVLDELGRGGMGVVFLAADAEGRRLALKTLLPERLGSGRARERFLREMTAHAKLRHPHLVQLLSAGEHEGAPWLAFEFVQGGSLETRLHEGGPLPVDTAQRLMAQVAGALAYLHERGILHRDLKPGNVLLRNEHALLTDFGLVLDSEHQQRLSLTGAFLGTPGFWAPEQARGAKLEHGPGADVYGLGALLYACLTGRPPVVADTLVDHLMLARQVEAIVPLRDARPGVPNWLSELCSECLAKDPAARPTAANVKLRLERGDAFADEVGVTWVRRVLPAAVLLGGALALVAGVVALSAESFRPPRAAGIASADSSREALERLEGRARAGNWLAILAAREQAATWSGAELARWEQLLDLARRALLRQAWDELDFELGLEAWDAGPPLAEPAAAWLLAAAGRTEDAPLEEITDHRERAWLAAWAGNLEACEAALSQLGPGRAERLRWWLREALPALELGPPPSGESPEERLTRAVRALSLGRLGLAAALLPNLTELTSPEQSRDHRLVTARLALAWGDPVPLRRLAAEQNFIRDSSLERLRAWALCREVAPWLEPAARKLAIQPLPDFLRDPSTPWALDAGGRLAVAVRGRGHQGGPPLRPLLVAAGADPELAAGSAARAELDACRRGLGGAWGLQLARVADVVAAADSGGTRSPTLLDDVDAVLERLAEAGAERPAYALVALRLARLRAPPDEDAYRAFAELSPGDAACVYELARARETWSSWSISDDLKRIPHGFAEAAAGWERVEQACAGFPRARRARLRRVRALADAAADEPPDSPAWTPIRALLAPHLTGLPIADAARLRHELADCLLGRDLPAFDRVQRELFALASGPTPDELEAIYLSAALGDVEAADAYTALAGDALALAALELRRVEGTDEELGVAEALAKSLQLPAAHLAAAGRGLDSNGRPSPSPLHLAAVAELAPAEAHAVLSLLKATGTAPPDVEARLREIDDAEVSPRRRLLARALLYAWRDAPREVERPEPWSVAAADALCQALEDTPAHAGLRHLRAAVLAPPDPLRSRPLLLRALKHDLDLAQAALPWALGVRLQRLQLEGDPTRHERQVDQLGARGLFWRPGRPQTVAPPLWPAAIWDLDSLEPPEIMTLPSQLFARQPSTGLSALAYASDQKGVRWSEPNLKQLRELAEGLAKSEPDPLRKRLVLEDLNAGFVDALGNTLRLEHGPPILRELAAAPRVAVQRTVPSALFKRRARARYARVEPDGDAFWTRELSRSLGWRRVFRLAELWRDLNYQREDYEPTLYTPAQLCDPWSRTRATLDGLLDPVRAHHATRIARFRGAADGARMSLSSLHAMATSRLPPLETLGVTATVRPSSDFMVRVWSRRFPGISRAQAGLAAYCERFQPAEARACRVDWLLEAVYRFDEGAASPEELAQCDRDFQEALQLGMALDPDRVPRHAESRGVSWYRRVRTAALAGERETMLAALTELDRAVQAGEAKGLRDLLDSDPWSTRLGEVPGLGSLFEEN